MTTLVTVAELQRAWGAPSPSPSRWVRAVWWTVRRPRRRASLEPVIGSCLLRRRGGTADAAAASSSNAPR